MSVCKDGPRLDPDGLTERSRADAQTARRLAAHSEQSARAARLQRSVPFASLQKHNFMV